MELIHSWGESLEDSQLQIEAQGCGFFQEILLSKLSVLLNWIWIKAQLLLEVIVGLNESCDLRLSVSHHSSCLHLLLPLQEFNSLQDGPVVMDSMFSQNPLVLFGVVTSQQRHYVDLFIFLGALLFGGSPAKDINTNSEMCPLLNKRQCSQSSPPTCLHELQTKEIMRTPH